jgi:SPP1 gp7 family putative phage head morphogenesis protein
VRLPAIEAAVQHLQGLQLIDEAGFRRLERDARRGAFTVARIASEDAMAKVRDAVMEDVRDGGTLRQFRQRVEDALGGSMLAERHLETVYRTNTAKAMTAGLMEALAHPLVADEFPYLAYHATHDARTRENHLRMETLGLDGTNIYRRDDPVWRTFLPPWDFNCRCMVTPMTVEDAAAAGVSEARAWLADGVPPPIPCHVEAPPFGPSSSWAAAQSGERLGGIA